MMIQNLNGKFLVILMQVLNLTVICCILKRPMTTTVWQTFWHDEASFHDLWRAHHS